MAHPKSRTPPATPLLWPEMPAAQGYEPGGPVGQMHTDLVQRLGSDATGWTPIDRSSGERAVRFVSVAGGYAALLAAYVGAAVMLFG